MFGCKVRDFLLCNQTILPHKPCGNAILFPDHQVARQLNFLCLASPSPYIIFSSQVFIELGYESSSNSCTFFIDRIQTGICHVFNTLNSTFIQSQWFYHLIDFNQLFPEVWQAFEYDTFWMSQKQKVDSLIDWLHFYFHVIIIREHNPHILSYDKPAKFRLFF